MGIDRYVYAANDTTWVATFMERIEKQSKGYNAVSLSNYDATGVCVITDGSAFEIAGSMYLCTTDTSITASCATGVCYIMATGATATASVAWSTTAPVWRDDLQGYYASAASVVRALAGTYFDGASYQLKWVYKGIHTGPKAKYLQASFGGWAASGITMGGDDMTLGGISTGAGYPQMQFPRNFVATQWETYCSSLTDGQINVRLERYTRAGASQNVMYTSSHTATGTITVTALDSDNIFDESAYKYFINVFPTTTTVATIDLCEIQGYEIIR